MNRRSLAVVRMCMTAIPPSGFKSAMRRMASSVSIVTTTLDGIPAGLVATAVCSVSAEPPMLLACINKQAQSHEAFARSGTFCVNVLASHQAELADRFAKAIPAERFVGLDWHMLATGSPALADALISFGCETDNMVIGGTHTVFFGRIVELRHNEAEAPLLYFDGRYADVVPKFAKAPQSSASSAPAPVARGAPMQNG